jgi:hypothetical protein
VSAVERKPAQLVAQPLVVEHQFSDLVGELGALPMAFQAAGRITLVLSRRRTLGLDRVGRGAQLVGRHMPHCRGLAGCVRGVPGGSAQLSRGSLGVAGRRASLPPRDLAARPCPPEVDRSAGPRVRGLHRLEVVKHVLCARGRPDRQKTMVVVLEGPAATHGDETRIPNLGEDHQLPISLSRPPEIDNSITSDEPAFHRRSVAVPQASLMPDKERGHSSRLLARTKGGVAFADYPRTVATAPGYWLVTPALSKSTRAQRER